MIGFVAVDVIRDDITQQDVALKDNVACVCSLLQGHRDPQKNKRHPLREAAGKFAEAIRFSDPVSNASLSEIESELSACVDEIQRAVTDDDSTGAIALLDRANVLLLERNRLCKLNKAEKN